MSLALTILFDGLTYAAWLFIVALGLTLVFGVLKILNIAHGSFYAVGAYAGASLVAWLISMKFSPALSVVALVLAAAGVAALLAPLTERGLLRMFYQRDEVLLVLVTYALFLILEDVTKLLWGVHPYYASDTYQAFGMIQLGALNYAGYDLMLFVVALRELGTGRTGAYFSVAPFFGTLLAVLALGEPVSWRLAVAALLMAAGVWLHLTERHEHLHAHEALEHTHEHVHGAGDTHHDHVHVPPVAPGTRHSHPHQHAPLVHSHPHYPDAHHRHEH